MTPPGQPSTPAQPDLETVLARFEQAWRQTPPPALEKFLPPRPSGNNSGAGYRELLEELVKIDLNYRWQRAVTRGGAAAPLRGGSFPDKPRLEDYVTRYPDLGPVERLSADLIGAEYWIRLHLGDRPTKQEYLTRFSRQGPALVQVLNRIEAEVSAEFTRNIVGPAAAVPVASLAPVAKIVEAPPAPGSVAAFVETIRRCQLLTAPQVEELTRQLQPRCPDARALARELLQRNWLTPYQVNCILQGRAQDLVLGSYVLLERLGAGGAGQVFKARHQLMQRVVALKVIRKELLADADTVARFHREIQVISTLSHPNVVQAYDAGQIGQGYFLAMEFVDGVDLGQLVKKSGPLPFAQATEYVRQAAQGLQYICERGLVHRDIKPANLLLAGGTIKILDLGLARLQRPVDGASAGTLTGADPVLMGTLDYMAPEQAIHARAVDIRADIYSLGCTLYFLLAGQPPFAERTLAQKLLAHQQVEPPPLGRKDLPPGMLALVGKMMAKAPEDRYQTPGEAAAALAQLAGQFSGVPLAAVAGASKGELVPVAVLLPTAAPARQVVVIDQQHGPSLFQQRFLPIVRQALAVADRRLPKHKWLRRAVVLGLMLATLAGVGLLGWWALTPSAPKIVYLSDLEAEKVQGAEFLKDGQYKRNNAVQRITVQGKTAEKGLFTRPPRNSTILVTYRLGKRYKTFKATVALNDGSSTTEPVTFSVILDGKPKWTSKGIEHSGVTDRCDIDVSGVDKLELSVFSRLSDADSFPVWIDPQLGR
jgi:serine/threonine-protein kinase